MALYSLLDSLTYRRIVPPSLKSHLCETYDFLTLTTSFFAVKLDRNRTHAFANSFNPLTSRDWNPLSARSSFSQSTQPSDVHDPYQSAPSSSAQSLKCFPLLLLSLQFKSYCSMSVTYLFIILISYLAELW